MKNKKRWLDLVIAIWWIFLGILVIWKKQGLRGIIHGETSSPGDWWNYFTIIFGIGVVITGILYFFMPQVRRYLDKEAEQIEPFKRKGRKGKYWWFFWYTIIRLFRR